MKRRSKASDAKAKKGRRKAARPKRRNAEAAPRRSSSAPGPEADVAHLVRERDEALEWQTATAEILSSMSDPTADPGPIFDAIVRNVLRLFGTGFAVVTLVHNGALELVGIRGEPGFEKLARHYPLPLNNRTLAGRAIASRK